MNWTNIVGHVDKIKMLRHMESNGRVPHGILLSGSSGIGKFMVASVLGGALLCTSLESRPCGSCQSCLHRDKPGGKRANSKQPPRHNRPA